MKKIKLVVVDDNCNHHLLGVFDLEAVPRAGEFVWYERQGGDGMRFYEVKYVNYFVEPTSSIEIWLNSPEDEDWTKID